MTIFPGGFRRSARASSVVYAVSGEFPRLDLVFHGMASPAGHLLGAGGLDVGELLFRRPDIEFPIHFGGLVDLDPALAELVQLAQVTAGFLVMDLLRGDDAERALLM
jgi:hypothetical protein